MKLETLKPNKGAKHRKKRLGSGESSGLGKTCGRGHKGQKARTGHRGTRPGFEGGQMPLSRRLPKKGFNNSDFRRVFAVVNVGDLERVDGDTVNEQTLRAAGLVSGSYEGIKILGTGELKRKLKVEAHRASRTALEKIAAAGGSFEELTTKADAKRSEAAVKKAASRKAAE